MNKLFKGTVAVGMGLFLVGGHTALAADVLDGDTNVTAEVIAGDITLTIDQTVDFGQQPLAETVDFGTQNMGYIVTDFSGLTNGYTLTAKVTDENNLRTLGANSVTLNTTDGEIVSAQSNNVGANTGNFDLALSYSGVTEAKEYTSTIEWTLTKASVADIQE